MSKTQDLKTVDDVVAFLKENHLALSVTRRDDRYLLDSLPGEAPGSLPGPRPLPVAGPLPNDGADPRIQRPGVWACRSAARIPEGVATEIERILNDNSDSELARLSTIPVDRAFVYLDVADFSTNPPARQLLILNSLLRARDGINRSEITGDLEATLCIGDGYIFVFKTALWATWFAAFLAVAIEEQVSSGDAPDYHFRASVHWGSVYRFRDGTGAWNYIGEGSIGGQRVLECAGKAVDDVVHISGETRAQLLAQSQTQTGKHCSTILSALINRGRHEAKHQRKYRIYELPHFQLKSDYWSLAAGHS
jgi:hypothetical protein